MKKNNTQILGGKKGTMIIGIFGAFILLFSPAEAQVANLSCDYNENLIINGSFEVPTLPSGGYGWDVFPSEVNGLVWKVEWIDSTGAPAVPLLEIQNGYTARDGVQYAELDSNWTVAPGTPYNGEATSVAIQQTIATNIGEEYVLTWSFSPIPYHDTLNILEVLVDGVVVASNSANGVGLTDTNWVDDKITFTASATSTTITFRDAGTIDSFGTLLDNVCLSEVNVTTTTDSNNGTASRSGTVIRPSSGLVLGDTIEIEEVEILPLISDENPTPLVLGEQVSVIPVGAPNTGAGGSTNNSTLTLNNILLSTRRQDLV